MLKSMKPKHADSFVDNLFGMGPPTRYKDRSIPENPNIHQFIYKGIQVFRRLVSLVEMAGVTISGEKLVAATPALTALGTVVSLLGGHVTHKIMAKILKWPVCQSVSDVHGFLGTAGYVRKWIKNFAKIALPLTMLTRHSPEIFNWSTEANEAFEQLKFLASTAPPLIKIDFKLALKITRPDSVFISRNDLAIPKRWSIWTFLPQSESPCRMEQKRMFHFLIAVFLDEL